MEQNYLNVREDFRVVMLKALNISFPRMSFRYVLDILGNEQARVLLEVMKSENFYLLFMVNPEVPKDIKQEHLDLFEHPSLMRVMNVFRVAKVRSYLDDTIELSQEMRDFLQATFYYLNSSCLEAGERKSCCNENFMRAKKHFQQEEISVIRNWEQLSQKDRQLLIEVVTLVVEEISQESFDKILRICGLVD